MAWDLVVLFHGAIFTRSTCKALPAECRTEQGTMVDAVIGSVKPAEQVLIVDTFQPAERRTERSGRVVNPVDSDCSRPDAIAGNEILSITSVLEIPPTSNDEPDPTICSISPNDESDPIIRPIPPHNNNVEAVRLSVEAYPEAERMDDFTYARQNGRIAECGGWFW